MNEETQKIITEQMRILPADVKQAIISVDYKTKLQEITQRQRLLIDQAGKLEMETTLVMIGLEPLADFTGNIQREMRITETRAREIAMDVSESIFKPIRDSLQMMNEEVVDEEVVGKPEEEEPATKFTDTNDADLNRDQILKEIENPASISGGGSVNMSSAVTQAEEKIPVNIQSTKEIEIRPAQELETLPGEGVRDITKTPAINIFESKMTSSTITPQQIVTAKPETKLPEVSKKTYNTGNDPYREPIA
jgi:hypothetical protein